MECQPLNLWFEESPNGTGVSWHGRTAWQFADLKFRIGILLCRISFQSQIMQDCGGLYYHFLADIRCKAMSENLVVITFATELNPNTGSDSSTTWSRVCRRRRTTSTLTCWRWSRGRRAFPSTTGASITRKTIQSWSPWVIGPIDWTVWKRNQILNKFESKSSRSC